MLVKGGIPRLQGGLQQADESSTIHAADREEGGPTQKVKNVYAGIFTEK